MRFYQLLVPLILVPALAAACSEEPALDCSGATPVCGASLPGEHVGFCTEGADGIACRAVCTGPSVPQCTSSGVVCVTFEGAPVEQSPLCVPEGAPLVPDQTIVFFYDTFCGPPGPEVTDPTAYKKSWVTAQDLGNGRIKMMAESCGGEQIFECFGPYHALKCVPEGEPHPEPAPTATAPPTATATGTVAPSATTTVPGLDSGLPPVADGG